LRLLDGKVSELHNELALAARRGLEKLSIHEALPLMLAA
jgi:hypothetical protein